MTKLFLTIWFALLGISECLSRSSLPVVDLSYTRHQAYDDNSTAGYYNFSNIRFALPPTGQNRFRAPIAPTKTNNTLTDGGSGNIFCPQATPIWNADIIPQLTLLVEALLEQNLTLYEDILEGVVVGNATSNTSSTALSSTPITATEDCLFLDLIVPKSVFENHQKNETSKAPVIVWLYGGGFVLGSKRDTSSPSLGANFAAGLIERSIASFDNDSDTIEPTIVVTPNYRMGLFGWLGGEEVAKDGTLNVGLLDQRLAFEWVQKYIHLFGGDAERITIMGESAGAGSIEFHITAEGGNGDSPPFGKAVMQSTTFYPVSRHDTQPDTTTRRVMALTNVTTLDELREVPTERLQKVNELIVAESLFGFWSFGPVVDDTYVPALPGRLLLDGRFHHNVSVMMGHNVNEGFIFTPPTLPNTTSAFSTFLAQQFPEADTSTLSTIENSIYAPVFNGSEGYITEFGRQQQLYDDSQFICNNIFIANAFKGDMYWYDFDVPPAYHGQDLPYTWASYPPVTSSTFNGTIATALQEYILSFVANGTPQSKFSGGFTTYGSDKQVLSLSSEGIGMMNDTTSAARCAWWQHAHI